MEIISPKEIVQTNKLMLKHTSAFEYIDPILNIPLTKSITFLTFGEFGVNPKPTIWDLSTAPDLLLKKYGAMQSLMKSCVDNAEDIKSNLLQIVLMISSPKTEEERVLLMKMDLMNLKQFFMDDIRKSKIYQEFKEFSSTKKLKPFSQAFNTFILDRNKYTHGHLCFIKPNYDFALEYIETPSQKIKYALIDTTMLLSYNNCYKEIRDVISEYNVIQQPSGCQSHSSW